MSFSLIDRILALEPGVRIEAVKCLSIAEEYLHDHFPRFPVMPGVMMLESMFQAAAWLIRATDQFQSPVVILREARNIKYADFVEPSQQLRLTAEIQKRAENLFTLKTQGVINGRVAVSGRLLVELSDLPERAATRKVLLPVEMARIRNQFHLLYKPESSSAAAS